MISGVGRPHWCTKPTYDWSAPKMDLNGRTSRTFFAAAAEAMRRILVESARRKRAISLNPPMIAPVSPTVDFAGKELVGTPIGPYACTASNRISPDVLAQLGIHVRANGAPLDMGW